MAKDSTNIGIDTTRITSSVSENASNLIVSFFMDFGFPEGNSPQNSFHNTDPCGNIVKLCCPDPFDNSLGIEVFKAFGLIHAHFDVRHDISN